MNVTTDKQRIAEQAAKVQQPIDLARENKIYQDIVLAVTSCGHYDSAGNHWTDTQKAIAKVKTILAAHSEQGWVSVSPETAISELIEDAERVLNKYGVQDDGTPKDWTEWQDLRVSLANMKAVKNV